MMIHSLKNEMMMMMTITESVQSRLALHPETRAKLGLDLEENLDGAIGSDTAV